MMVFTLQNDLQQIQNGDFMCILRGFLSYALCATHCYSYLLQAVYQYISIIHPTRLFWKSAQTQLCLIGFFLDSCFYISYSISISSHNRLQCG